MRVPELIDAREEESILEMPCASKLRAAEEVRTKNEVAQSVGDQS